MATAGHVVGGGHLEPVLVLLLLAGVGLGAFGWLRRERGLLTILVAVVLVQVLAHATFTVGHAHAVELPMLAGHAAAAVMLAGFLRLGEARAYAIARGRYLRWATAVRCAVAGIPAVAVLVRRLPMYTQTSLSSWIHRVSGGRGPPVTASC
jgi:hypothetical protein